MLKAYNREYDPFLQEYFVMCEALYADGFELKFGDKYPEFCQVNFREIHFRNGAIGTKEEFESLDGEPVKLYQKDPMMPIALFVQDPEGNFEKLKELAKKEDKEPETFIPEDVKDEDEEEQDPFSIENAKLIHHKKDLQAYAALYGIRLRVANNVSKDKMLETLEERAKNKGLL